MCSFILTKTAEFYNWTLVQTQKYFVWGTELMQTCCGCCVAWAVIYFILWLETICCILTLKNNHYPYPLFSVIFLFYLCHCYLRFDKLSLLSWFLSLSFFAFISPSSPFCSLHCLPSVFSHPFSFDNSLPHVSLWTRRVLSLALCWCFMALFCIAITAGRAWKSLVLRRRNRMRWWWWWGKLHKGSRNVALLVHEVIQRHGESRKMDYFMGKKIIFWVITEIKYFFMVLVVVLH